MEHEGSDCVDIANDALQDIDDSTSLAAVYIHMVFAACPFFYVLGVINEKIGGGLGLGMLVLLPMVATFYYKEGVETQRQKYRIKENRRIKLLCLGAFILGCVMTLIIIVMSLFSLIPQIIEPRSPAF